MRGALEKVIVDSLPAIKASEKPITPRIRREEESFKIPDPLPLSKLVSSELFQPVLEPTRWQDTVEDDDFKSYFSKDIRRKYCLVEGSDNAVGKGRKVLLAKEEVAVVSDIYLLTVFDSPEEFFDGENKASYLPMRHLFLVKKDPDANSLDLVGILQHSELYQDDKVKKEEMRIGLLPYSQETTQKSVLGPHHVFFTDAPYKDAWQFLGAPGEKEYPVIDEKYAKLVAVIKAIQTRKIEELTPLQRALIGEFRPGRGEPLQEALLRIATNITLQSDLKKFGVDLNAIKLKTLIRLERNAMAATLVFFRQLRSKGFDLFPTLPNRRSDRNAMLIREAEDTLRELDNLHELSEGDPKFSSEVDMIAFMDDLRKKVPDLNIWSAVCLFLLKLNPPKYQSLNPLDASNPKEQSA